MLTTKSGSIPAFFNAWRLLSAATMMGLGIFELSNVKVTSSGSVVSRVVEGLVTVNPNVTR